MTETNSLMGNGKQRRPHQTCAVYGCKAKVFKMYGFPNPKTELQRFMDWLNACKNPRFNNLTNQVIFRRGYICEIHFKEIDFVPCTNKKLYRSAIPSLHLPNVVEGFVHQVTPKGLDLPSGEQDKFLTKIKPCYDVPFKDLPFLQTDNTERIGMKTVSDFYSLLEPKLCKLEKNYKRKSKLKSNLQDDVEPSKFIAHPTVNCRICLAQTIQAFSLIEKPQIADMLESLISTKISKTDLLPTMICLKCFLNLKLAYNIQQKMLKAEQNLQETLQTQNIDCTVESEMNLEDSSQNNENCVPEIIKPRKKQEIKSNSENNKPEACPICKRKYKNLKNHLKGHKDGTSLCDICGLSMSALSLTLHKFKKHKIFLQKCKFCDKSFTNKSRKERHEIKDHDGQPNYMCEFCGKRFYFAKYLRFHVGNVHYKKRPFVCNLCSVAYTTSQALKNHQLVHRKVRLFECQICDKKFSVRWRLRNHLLKRHQMIENLNWECKECKKKFATELSLSLHSRIHY